MAQLDIRVPLYEAVEPDGTLTGIDKLRRQRQLATARREDRDSDRASRRTLAGSLTVDGIVFAEEFIHEITDEPTVEPPSHKVVAKATAEYSHIARS